MIEEAQIKEIERELRLLRNQLANCESQNRILIAYVAENERRKEARRHRVGQASRLSAGVPSAPQGR